MGAQLPPDVIRDARATDLVQLAESYGVKMAKQGKDFFGCCPFHTEDTPSFTIFRKDNGPQRFQCFGCGASGDPIQFVQSFEGLKFRDAVYRLVGNLPATGNAPTPSAAHVPAEPEEVWTPVLPVPDSAQMTPDTIRRKIKGQWTSVKASRRWDYRDANGDVLGYVFRFDMPGGGKEVLPLVWAVSSTTGEMQWRWISFPKPRPMYGLDKLAENTNALVMLVEGEKAADAAQELFIGIGLPMQDLVVVSWPGGGKAIKHVDWSPLVGRAVALWPDADQKPYPANHERAGVIMPFLEQPGTVAMLDAWAAIRESASRVKFVMPPANVPDGWDLADPPPPGFDLLRHVKHNTMNAADVERRFSMAPSISADDKIVPIWFVPAVSPAELRRAAFAAEVVAFSMPDLGGRIDPRGVQLRPFAGIDGLRAALKEARQFLPAAHLRVVLPAELGDEGVEVAEAAGASIEALKAGECWVDSMWRAAGLQEPAEPEVAQAAEVELGDAANAAARADARANIGKCMAAPAKKRPKPDDAPAYSPKTPMKTARGMISRIWSASGQRTIHRAGGSFFTWSGAHYIEAEDEAVRSAIYHHLEGARCFVRENGGESSDELLKPFNPDSASVSKAQDALCAVAQLPGGRPKECWLDGRARPSAQEVISVANGLLHMPTRELLPHDPLFFTQNTLPFDYNHDAPDPVEWTRFLEGLWPGDPDSIALLQRWMGYLLSASTGLQKMMLLIGPPRSGKGTIMRIMKALLGDANVAGPRLSAFATQFGLEPLIGKRAAIVGDARLSGKIDQGEIVGSLLSITGEDTLTIDRKNRAAWSGVLPVRITICTNEMPRLQDASGALASRFLILQMQKSFLGQEDHGLGERIERELPGILKWALDGWDALQREGRFPEPAASKAAIGALGELSSPIRAFVAETCDLDHTASTPCQELFNAWVAWCKQQGRDHPGILQSFGRDLAAAVAGLKVSQPRNGDEPRRRVYEGIRLRDSDACKTYDVSFVWDDEALEFIPIIGGRGAGGGVSFDEHLRMTDAGLFDPA